MLIVSGIRFSITLVLYDRMASIIFFYCGVATLCCSFLRDIATKFWHDLSHS